MTTVTERDDAVLVTAALAGDTTAVGDIYERYADRVYSFCLSRLRNSEQAADATHETFVRAAQRLSSLRQPRKLRSWLFAIARNQIVDQARQRDRSTSLEAVGDVSADLPDHDTDLVAAESAQLLWDAAGSLQERDLDLLELQLRQGLEGEALADALGVTTSHLHVLQSRMKDRVEKALGSLLIARHGREDCDRLQDLLGVWDGRFTLEVRSQVTRHVQSCDICRQTQAAVLVPGRFLGVLPLVVAPIALKARTAAAMEQALGITAAGVAPDASSVGAHVSTITPITALSAWQWREDGFPLPRQRHGGRSAVWWFSLAAGLLIVVGLAVTAISQWGGSPDTDVASVAGPPATPTADASGPTPDPDPLIVAPAEPTATPINTASPTSQPATTATSMPSPSPTATLQPTATPTSTPRPTSVPAATTVPLTPGSIRVDTTQRDLGFSTSRTLSLTNPGQLPATWTATADAPFSVTPAGEVAGGGAGSLIVSFDPAGLSEGLHQEVVTMSWASGSATINVTAEVDRTPPEVTRVSQRGSACTGDAIEMVVLVRDDPDIAGVAVDWTSSDGTFGRGSLTQTGGGGWIGNIGPIARRGTVTGVATATDFAGNTGTATTTFTVNTCLGFSS
jgi:RNA polymerase sigma factor (sigma-70 family)